MWTKLAIVAAALSVAATGCVVDAGTDTNVSPSYGTLSTYWTLDNGADSDVCAYYGVDRVDVIVYDDDGFDVADAQPFCEDFGVSFDVDAGYYSTEVTLLDADGFAVSDTVVVDDVRITRDTEAVVDVDFPDASIF